MRVTGILKFPNKHSLLAGVAMTAMERRAGRFLRAPDHDAGTGGAADAGASGGSADGAAAGDAGANADAAAAAAAASGNDGSAGGEGAGAAASDDGTGSGADQDAAAGDDDGDDGTALGGAAKADDEGDGGRGGDGAAEHVVPEAYELTAPDGMAIDQDLLAEATPVFQEMGLSNDQANMILPVAKSLMGKTQQSTIQGMIDAGNQQRKAWLDSAKSDAEIGGKNWDTSLHSAGKALDALGHPEGSPFRQALNETGFGNHPEFIRIFAGLGARIGEDGDFVRGDAAAKVHVPLEKRLYPDD